MIGSVPSIQELPEDGSDGKEIGRDEDLEMENIEDSSQI